MEEISGTEAVVLWARHDRDHHGHEGEVARYDFLLGSQLILECAECGIEERYGVCLDDLTEAPVAS